MKAKVLINGDIELTPENNAEYYILCEENYSVEIGHYDDSDKPPKESQYDYISRSC